MSKLQSQISSTAGNLANQVAVAATPITSFLIGQTPQGKIYKTVEFGLKVAVIIICLILLITGIILFATNDVSSGIWVTGAAIALGAIYYWGENFRYGPVKIAKPILGALDTKQTNTGEFEEIGLDDFKPDDWD